MVLAAKAVSMAEVGGDILDLMPTRVAVVRNAGHVYKTNEANPCWQGGQNQKVVLLTKLNFATQLSVCPF